MSLSTIYPKQNTNGKQLKEFSLKLRMLNINTYCFGGVISTVIEEQQIKGIRIVKEETKLSYTNKKIVHIENPRVSIETELNRV